MCRALALLLSLAAIAAAQGVDDWIEIATDARTPPEQRIDALKKIAQAQSKEALDKLADRGLDRKLDPEVVNAVVETLLKAPDYKPYVERICRLLTAEKHRTKVLRRLKDLWEADRGLPLFEACMAIAKETGDPAMKEAAILSLSKIPRRKAAETIVAVGLASQEESVKAAARAYVARWFGVATLREASDFLAARKFDSFHDLVEARVDSLIAEKAAHDERMRAFWEKASAGEALDELEMGEAYRLPVAQRLAKLAEQNGIEDRPEFARRVYEGFLREIARDPPDPRVLTQLLTALLPVARDTVAGPLWKTKKVAEVRDALLQIVKIPAGGAEYRDLGLVAVGFVGAIDDEGRALYAFAEGFPSVDVRKGAIQQLGQLAQRVPKQKDWVSIRLAALLAGAEKEPVLRAQILSLLTQPLITVATEPDVVKIVRGYLEAGAPDMTDAELRDCATVLGKRRTPEVREALLNLARTHEKLQVRRFAVEEGLVPWARADESIHDELVALVLAPDAVQPFDARKAVVEALGKRGGRRGGATLLTIEQAKDVDPALLPFVKEAKFVLARRLANGEGNAADAPDQKPLDLEAAARLLEQEIGGSDVDRLLELAGQIVKACDAANCPAGTARYRFAWLYAKLPPDKVKDADLLKRYADAASKALNDKLPVTLRETLLLDYRALLLRGTPDADRLGKALGCSEDLAQLAIDQKNKEKAAAYWLDAAELAVKLGDGGRARGYCDAATASGGLVGELGAREQDLRGRASALKG